MKLKSCVKKTRYDSKELALKPYLPMRGKGGIGVNFKILCKHILR